MLPSWWGDVRQVMGGLPVALWAAILYAESGGRPDAYAGGAEDSVGLFQLNRAGGQGTGYDADWLGVPRNNASIAKRSILAAYQEIAPDGVLTPDRVAEIAIRSGHPGPVPQNDPRVQRIVALWRQADASSQTDDSLWNALTGGGGGSGGTTPPPNAPQDGIDPWLGPKAVGNLVGEGIKVAGVALIQKLQTNQATAIAVSLGLGFIAIGAYGLARQGS